MNELIRDWDNFWSAGYKNTNTEIGWNVLSEESDLTIKLLKEFKQGDSVFEAGCGLGNWVFIFAKLGFSAYGLDISLASLRSAANYGHSNNLKYKLIQGDLRKVPLKDNSFNIIVSYGAVEHFPETSEAINEFKRILKPGGACLVTTPNPFNFHRLIGRHILNITRSKKLGYVGHEDAYTPRQLGRLFEKCGFSRIRYGVLSHGFGCIFSCFWNDIPLIGKPLYKFLDKIAFFIQKYQNTAGGASYVIGYKE